MSKSVNKQPNWRSKISYISTAISISMVIYVLGLVGFILLKAKTLSDQSKEKFCFEIYLKDNVKEVEIMQLKKQIDAQESVIKTVFKSKEDALAEFREDLSEDENFMSVLGKNPLPPNIEVYFDAEYTHPDSIQLFQHNFVKGENIISDFKFPSNLLYAVHANVQKISMFLLIVGGLLLFVAIALINNTIRLRVYAQRFLIRTMQLIGASKSYIRRPFLANAVVLGLLSGLLAVVALAASLHLFYDYWPDVAHELINFQQDIQLYIAMVVLGIIITWSSTLFAVSRFLRLKTEKLYY